MILLCASATSPSPKMTLSMVVRRMRHLQPNPGAAGIFSLSFEPLRNRKKAETTKKREKKVKIGHEAAETPPLPSFASAATCNAMQVPRQSVRWNAVMIGWLPWTQRVGEEGLSRCACHICGLGPECREQKIARKEKKNNKAVARVLTYFWPKVAVSLSSIGRRRAWALYDGRSGGRGRWCICLMARQHRSWMNMGGLHGGGHIGE